MVSTCRRIALPSTLAVSRRRLVMSLSFSDCSSIICVSCCCVSSRCPAASKPELAARMIVRGVLKAWARPSSTVVRSCSVLRAASAVPSLTQARWRSNASAARDAKESSTTCGMSPWTRIDPTGPFVLRSGRTATPGRCCRLAARARSISSQARSSCFAHNPAAPTEGGRLLTMATASSSNSCWINSAICLSGEPCRLSRRTL